MNNLVAVVGMCGAGKSVATSFFKEKGYKDIYLGSVTINKLKEENLEITPESEQMMKLKIREKYGMGAYALLLIDEIRKSLEKDNVVLDGVYSFSELKVLKEEFNNICVLAIVTDKSLRYERLEKRKVRPFTKEQAEKRDVFEIENCEKGGPISYADYYILNNGSKEEYEKNLEDIYKIIEKRN